MTRHRLTGITGIVVVALWAACSMAATTTFQSAGDWSTGGNWSAGVPGNGDDAVVNAAVTLSATTADLASYVLNAGITHTFSGTNTALKADVVTINGTMTHNAQTGTGTNDPPPDHRVWIVCSNLLISSTGKIDADLKGFGAGAGLGGGIHGGGGWYGGGGYGGRGGQGWVGVESYGHTYGSATAPSHPGSGGGQAGGGKGGGWARIEASGHVAVSGTITANGQTVGGGSGSGAGSGGGIYVTCNTFGGTNGLLTADGGDHTLVHTAAAGGGGGRIAVVYNTTAQSNLTAQPTAVAFGANQGQAVQDREMPGTIYMPDEQLLEGAVMQGGQILIPGFTTWTVGDFGLTGGHLIFADGFQLAVANDFTISGDGEVYFTNGLAIGGLLNPNGGILSVASALSMTNHDLTVAGTLLLSLTNYPFTVPGDLTISAGGDLQFLLTNDLVVGGLLNANGGAMSLAGGLSITNHNLTIAGGLDLALTNGTFTVPGHLTINAGADFAFGPLAANITNHLAIAGLLNVNGGAMSVAGGISMANHDLTVAGGLELALTNDTFTVPGHLTVNAGGDLQFTRLGDEAPDLAVASNVVVNGGSLSHYGRINNGATFTVGGDVTAANGGDLYVYSGMTNAATGRRRIAVILPSDDFSKSKAKRFFDLARDHGLTAGDDCGVFFDSSDPYRYADRFRQALQERFAGMVGFDSVWCGTDEGAAKTIQWLRGKALCVPEDVAVVGFNDSEFAECFDPAIASVSRADGQVAEQAESLLYSRLQQPDLAPRRVVVDMRFVRRRSAGDDEGSGR